MAVAISRDSKLVAAGFNDNVVRVWDVKLGHLLEHFEGHTDGISSIAFSPNTHEIISGSLDKTIKKWELRGDDKTPPLKGGRCIKTFEGHRVYHQPRYPPSPERYLLTLGIGLCPHHCLHS